MLRTLFTSKEVIAEYQADPIFSPYHNRIIMRRRRQGVSKDTQIRTLLSLHHFSKYLQSIGKNSLQDIYREDIHGFWKWYSRGADNRHQQSAKILICSPVRSALKILQDLGHYQTRTEFPKLYETFSYDEIVYRHAQVKIFGCHYESILSALGQAKYSNTVKRKLVFSCNSFSRFLLNNGVNRLERITPDQLEKYYQHYLKTKNKQHSLRTRTMVLSPLRLALKCLQSRGLYSEPVKQACRNSFQSQVIADYRDYLLAEKGLTLSTVNQHLAYLDGFLDFCLTHGHTRTLVKIKPSEVDQFLEKSLKGYGRGTKKLYIYYLKSFLKFMSIYRYHPHDLSAAISRQFFYRNEAPPAVFKWSDIERGLMAIDRHYPIGKRDYAIYLLLSTYGLRACSIRMLNLDDIDWQNNLIHINETKARRSLTLPLLPKTGNALMDYITNGRPKSSCRKVFLKAAAPYKEFATSGAIYQIVRKHLVASDNRTKNMGPHTIRHTVATRQVTSQTKLKTVGDILDHSRMESTYQYIKLDTERLREVCLDAEDLL